MGVNNRFPAFAAVIGAHQIVLVAADQAYQLLDRMLTEGFALLFPLRLDVRGLGLCHMRSMWGDRFL